MKKSILIFGSIACIITGTLRAECPNRIYLDIEYADLPPRYRGSHFDMLGLHAGYDFIKPHCFYFGTEGRVLMGSEKVDIYSHFRGFYRGRVIPLISRLEQRIGYTFRSSCSSQSTLIPFLGIGWDYVNQDIKRSSLEMDSLYAAGGIRINQNFCKWLDVGTNIKVLYHFIGRIRSMDYYKGHTYSMHDWAYELEFPFTIHLTSRTDLRLTPYLLSNFDSGFVFQRGARLGLGYRF